jgi:hypothetical protein
LSDLLLGYFESRFCREHGQMIVTRSVNDAGQARVGIVVAHVFWMYRSATGNSRLEKKYYSLPSRLPEYNVACTCAFGRRHPKSYGTGPCVSIIVVLW